MVNSFNKGEWSEFYTFVKLLADRKVYAADENLSRIEDIFYPILKILRNDNGNHKTYDLSSPESIKILTPPEQVVSTIDPNTIKPSVEQLFSQIKNGSGASFTVACAEEIMSILGCEKVKAENRKKEDIRIVIHDSITLRESNIGFSIKSNIGGPPTLLNASGATNFVYQVHNNASINISEVNNISSKSKIRDRILAIEQSGASLHFSDIPHNVFRKNIRKNDSLMPLILSEYLYAFYTGQGRTIVELTNIVANSQVIQGINLGFDYDDIKFKIKQLLLNTALGMVPATKWDGFLKADGGYLVVKDDGDILCYHIYNIAQFSEYLFNQTKLETPSSSKHGFGQLYEENGQMFFKLNLQIRFL